MVKYTFLIAAGGTGGHLFPAMAVVEKLSEKIPDAEFLFTGRADKIEGDIIPKLGYEFIPIQIEGFYGLSFKTFLLPFKILLAKSKLTKIIKNRKVNAVIATGAYISYAPGIAAKSQKIPLFLLESNVNPGKTISILSHYADLIFTSYENSKNYFNPSYYNKIICSGNPLRNNLFKNISKEEALNKLGLPVNKKTLLIFGGSLGANSINNTVNNILNELVNLDINIIWQTGKNFTYNGDKYNNLVVQTFFYDMNLVYSASDLVVCRSGATTVAEIAALGKASILVPLPSASNNEQLLNAKMFKNNNAAILIEDNNLSNYLFETIKNTIINDENLNILSINAKKLSKKDAADIVAEEIIYYLNKNGREL